MNKSGHIAKLLGALVLQLSDFVSAQVRAEPLPVLSFTSSKRNEPPEEIDKKLSLARESGKTIVIMAALNFRHRYPSDTIEDMHLADQGTDVDGAALIDKEAMIEWRGEAIQHRKFAIRERQNHGEPSVSSSVYRFSVGVSTYHIFILEPGRYQLSSIRHPMPRTTLPERDQVAGSPASNENLGTVSLQVTSFNELRVEQRWQPDQWREAEAYQECAATYGGGCVEYRWVFGERELVRPAGYYDTLANVAVPGLNIDIELKKHFASFEAVPGQIIIVDGFYPDPPSADFAIPDCSGERNKRWICKLSALALVQAKASISDVKRFNFLAQGLRRFSSIVAEAQYQPLELSAKPIGKLGDATVYRLAN